MKKVFLAIAAAACFSQPGFAQENPQLDPAAVAASRQLFDAMNIRETMAASVKQMEQAMPAQMRSAMTRMVETNPKMSPEQKKAALAKMDSELPKMLARMHNTFGDPTLVDDVLKEMVPLYASTYTVDELHQLAAFYQSPVGRKMMASMPVLMTKSMEISNRLMIPRMQKMMGEAAQGIVSQ